MKEKLLTHSQVYSNQVLPELFHGAPAMFWKYLNQDGTKFLDFYWEKARETLPVDLRASSFGLNFTVSEPAMRTMVALIRLPEPKIAGESYFSALVYRPDRRILLVSDMTRVFNLEMTEGIDGNPGTLLVQWDTHLNRIEYPDDVRAHPDTFLETVLKRLDD